MSRILIAAGLGGTLPTLCRLGASYSVSPSQPAPAIGVYLALVLFFVIGMAVAYGFEEAKIKKAFVLGIAAPGIVTSIFSGALPADSQASQAGSGQSAAEGKTGALSATFDILGLDAAYAQDARGGGAGNGDAAAGASSQVAKKLIVKPSVTSEAWRNTGAVQLRFLTRSGVAINQLAVSSQLPSTVIVPPGATAVEAKSAGKTTLTSLPSSAFESAVLNLQVKAAPRNDFLWALGASRGASVSALSGSISDVKAPATTPTTSDKSPPATSDSRGEEEATQCGGKGVPADPTRAGCAPKQQPKSQ